VSRFVAYPSDHARLAHVLWIAHTHRMEAWESTPRIAFLSPEPGSGKSRALEVTELLVPRPVHAVNTTPAYLFRKVADEEGLPTILYDEIDTVFGPRAKENEDVRGMLNAGHRKGAVAGRCVVRGKLVETEELPAYCRRRAGRARRPAGHPHVSFSRCEDAPPCSSRGGRAVSPSPARSGGKRPSRCPCHRGQRAIQIGAGRKCRPGSRIAMLTCGKPCSRLPTPLAEPGRHGLVVPL